jgi:hypothetical protein
VSGGASGGASPGVAASSDDEQESAAGTETSQQLKVGGQRRPGEVKKRLVCSVASDESAMTFRNKRVTRYILSNLVDPDRIRYVWGLSKCSDRPTTGNLTLFLRAPLR